MDLITPTELGVYLRDDTARTSPAGLLACSLASEWVRSYCGWPITYVEYQDYILNGSGGRYVTLPTLMLLSIDTVQVDGVELSYPDDFTFADNGLVCRVNSTWPDRLACVEIGGVTHGYDRAALPDGVRLAALSIAAREYKNPEGLAEVASGTVRRKWTLRPLERHLLDRYRLPNI